MSTTSEDAEEETVTLGEHESSSVAIDSHVTVPGQPSIPEGQINIRETPNFSHKYFERQPNHRRIWWGGRGGTCPPWDFLRDPSGPGFEVAGSNFCQTGG